MPYYADVQGAPQNSIIGGASLWVMGGKKPEEYKGVAKFFAFLSETDRQVAIHKSSGYLPITKAAYLKTKESGYYKDHPYLETPILELSNKEPTENSRGLRLGNMVQLRDVWAEEIEAALAGKKSAKDALDAAVQRGNQMLRQFERDRLALSGNERPDCRPPDWVPMQKRSIFNHRLLPYALLGPQIAITVVFFYWPAIQAVWQSFLLQDAFGLSTTFVGLENFATLITQPEYYHTVVTTLVFSALVAVMSLSIALLLAVQADKPLRAAGLYRTLLIWPYAVAPAVAGVLWAFMFQPSFGVLARGLRELGY